MRIPLLDWFDNNGFLVTQAWNSETGKWMPGPTKLRLFPWQREILGHVFTPNADGEYPYSTVVYSTIKKSGKSAIGALVGAWAAETAPDSSEIYCVANDLEQAVRVYGDIAYHVLHSKIAKPTKYRIDYPDTRTYVQALAQEFASSAGSRHAVSIWDELWAYRSENSQRMWAEMTPPPTIPNAFRIIVTYAGYENESKLLWDLYESGWLNGEPIPELSHLVNTQGDPICRHKGKVFVMWDDVPRYPWQTDSYYEEQMATLRPSDFLRMHRNQWVTSSESFIDVKLWDRNVKLDGPALYLRDDKRLRYPTYCGVDIGPKHDCCAVVAVHYNTDLERVGLSAHQIWIPYGEFFDLEATVEKYLIELYRTFNVVKVLYDPYQFHRSATTLASKGIPVEQYPQTSGNMTDATQTLFSLLNGNKIDLYQADDLREHVQYSTAMNTPRGFRLVKEKHAKYKIDGAVALALACHACVSGGAPKNYDAINVTFPFADVAGKKVFDPNNAFLPPALQD